MAEQPGGEGAPPLTPARRGLTGDGDHEQMFGAASPGGVMALAIARGLRTKGWTRIASLVLALALVAGGMAIVASMIFG